MVTDTWTWFSLCLEFRHWKYIYFFPSSFKSGDFFSLSYGINKISDQYRNSASLRLLLCPHTWLPAISTSLSFFFLLFFLFSILVKIKFIYILFLQSKTCCHVCHLPVYVYTRFLKNGWELCFWMLHTFFFRIVFMIPLNQCLKYIKSCTFCNN